MITRRYLYLFLALVLTACGGGKPEPSPGEGSPGEETSEPPLGGNLTVDAGADQVVSASELLTLRGSADGLLEWRQTQGPAVVWPAGREGAQVQAIAPAAAGELLFELIATDGVRTGADVTAVTVTGCDAQAGTVFGECLSPPFGPWLAYASAPNIAGLYFDGEADRHVQWQTLDSGDAEHGQVIEITWNANDENHQVNANGWFGVALRDAIGGVGARDLSAYAEGTLEFDMRLMYHDTPNAPTPFEMKLECGHPCVSGFRPISGVEANYAWQTYRYSVADLVASGLALDSVDHALVIQPLWGQQEQTVTVQLDNIRFLPTYTPPDPAAGCIASGDVSYTLARAANPSADQLDAYQRITEAMDVAVAKYNCYTNLSRALYVQYNPDVATADGSPNGSIRFGSRASMHYVTAMHEISHVFGVGAGNYRTLVVDRVFTGPLATAKLRELTGDPTARINSDGTHQWPYGLNYISEGGTEEDLLRHCLIIEAVAEDLRNL